MELTQSGFLEPVVSCSRCKGKYYFSRLYGFKSGRPVLSRDIPNYPLISRYTPSVKAQKKAPEDDSDACKLQM